MHCSIYCYILHTTLSLSIYTCQCTSLHCLQYFCVYKNKCFYARAVGKKHLRHLSQAAQVSTCTSQLEQNDTWSQICSIIWTMHGPHMDPAWQVSGSYVVHKWIIFYTLPRTPPALFFCQGFRSKVRIVFEFKFQGFRSWI